MYFGDFLRVCNQKIEVCALPPKSTAPRHTISNSIARKLFMERQGLSDNPQAQQSKNDLLALIQKMGFVQIDSIRSVERAHHMILFARNQNYQPELLRQLLEEDRHLFEHWTHDASIIPTDFYPHWQRRFQHAEVRLRERWKKLRPTSEQNNKPISFEDMMAIVHSHIDQHGASMSRDFKTAHHKKRTSDGWWNWHPSKTALEFLWRIGDLSISGRNGFQKIYDLSDRVIPAIHKKKKPQSQQQFVHWACDSALDRLGFATHQEIANFWESIKPAEAKQWCERQSAKLIAVDVEGANGEYQTMYAKPDLVQQTESIVEPSSRVRMISPFDPIMRNRKRLQQLFGFDYRIEIYVPAEKRQYGYYVFPLLEGEQFIGRIDVKADRKEDRLQVAGLWLEPKIKPTKARLQKLNSELRRQAKFCDVQDISFAPGYIK